MLIHHMQRNTHLKNDCNSVVASFPVVSGYLQSVGAATAMGFAFPIVQAITKVAVEEQTIKE